MSKVEYTTAPYFQKGKGPRAWNDFLNFFGKDGWMLVFTQDLPTRRNCTFCREVSK